jgi:hypothetical protein
VTTDIVDPTQVIPPPIDRDPTAPTVKARAVVNELVHYEPDDSGDGQPVTVVQDTYSRFLESAEQPYQRTITVGEEWKPLSLGWVTEDGGRCALLYLQNQPTRFSVIPTAEQRAEADAKVVELGFDHLSADILISPGESARFRPSPDPIMVRCRKGTTKLLVTAVPA